MTYLPDGNKVKIPIEFVKCTDFAEEGGFDFMHSGDIGFDQMQLRDPRTYLCPNVTSLSVAGNYHADVFDYVEI